MADTSVFEFIARTYLRKNYVNPIGRRSSRSARPFLIESILNNRDSFECNVLNATLCECMSVIYVSRSEWIQYTGYLVLAYDTILHTIKVKICRVKSISYSPLRFNLFRLHIKGYTRRLYCVRCTLYTPVNFA